MLCELRRQFYRIKNCMKVEILEDEEDKIQTSWDKILTLESKMSLEV